MLIPHSRWLLVLLLAPLLFYCEKNSSDTGKEYKQEVDKWHQQRIESLKESDSWLTLAGLYPLANGNQSFGSDSSNSIVFPEKAADQIGILTKNGQKFTVEINDGVTVWNNGQKIEKTTLNITAGDKATVLRHKSLIWYIIERRDAYYLRLKDRQHPNLTAFEDIDRFPVSGEWKIQATFEPFEKPRAIRIPDILGETYRDTAFGMLRFTKGGKEYRLAPLGHPTKDESFFVIFADGTNGGSTYSGGRYLYVPTPGNDGTTYIDFNKSYNPPCVFTDYATCPLPPEQNRLGLKVTAGEMMYDSK